MTDSGFQAALSLEPFNNLFRLFCHHVALPCTALISEKLNFVTRFMYNIPLFALLVS